MTSSLAELPSGASTEAAAGPPRTIASSARRNGSVERARPNRLKVRDRQSRSDPYEQSPLLSPADDNEYGHFDGTTPNQHEEHFQASKSLWYLILLTISIGGLQIAWSVELSNGSPYLLSLGLSKSLMALVWIAGPLSGTLVQPYVGMLSDKCRISWGKRKPFMIAGTVATIVSLMCLGWTREIVGGFLSLFGADLESKAVKSTILCFAVAWVYVLDFAINTVQASIRAFIVDCAPSQQQEAANAMASRMTGVGNIIGYIAGYVNLPRIVWFFGDTQFKDLCAIASIALAATIALSCLTIRERDPRLEGRPPKDKAGVFAFFGKIFVSIRRLPPQTAKVCVVQFCAWIGFFPMLFYTSSFISEIYVEPYLEENPHRSDEDLDMLYEQGTRVGTFALLIFAIVSLATNILLPFLIAPTYDSVPIEQAAEFKEYEPRQKSWVDRFVIPGFTLRRAWMMSQVLFTICMLCTVFVRTVAAATALIGLVGITWALTLWAPWAIISAEIALRDAERRARQQGGDYYDNYGGDDDDDDDDDNQGDEEAADQAGVILGIHNMAIAAPQIIATVASSVIFNIFQKPRGTPGDRSIAMVLALGGITVFTSAFFIYRIQDGPTTAENSDDDEYSAMEQGQDESSSGMAPSTPGEPATPGGTRRPGHSHTKSYEQLPRASLQRAHLVRNKSFGGAEY